MKTKLQNKKYYIIDIAIILVITGLTIFYLVKNGIFSQLQSLTTMSIYGIIVLILMMTAFILIDSTIIYRTTKMAKINLNYGKCVEAYLFGNLGSAITPMKIGHFPLMFYYFSRNKISFDNSLKIICLNQIVYSTTTIILYFVIFLLCAINNTIITVLNITIHLKYIALIGFIFNIFAISLVLAMSYSKKFHSLIINICSWFLIKFKKITSKEEYKNEQMQKMSVYKQQIGFFLKHFHKFLPSIAIYFIYMFLLWGIPYVIYLFLTGSTFNLNDYLFFFSLNQTMSYISNIIPIPGGTGVAEFTFLTLYSVVFPENLIGAGMIIWRIFSYYLPFIIAFIIFIIFMCRKRKSNVVSQKNQLMHAHDCYKNRTRIINYGISTKLKNNIFLTRLNQKSIIKYSKSYKKVNYK